MTAELTPRERLVELMVSVVSSDDPVPWASLEEFFEGNDDGGSFGYNLPGGYGPQDVYPVLLGIRGRPEVSDVVVALREVTDESGWAVSDTVFVVTTASAATVAGWFPPELAPDDVQTQATLGPPEVRPYDVPVGFHVVRAWYD